MNSRAGLKKVVKTVRGKKGSVRRSYWVKANPKAANKLRNQGHQQPGFIRRNAGKIAAGAALGGLMYLNRHKMSGAAHGIASSLRGSNSKVSMGTRAHDAFASAKSGWLSGRQHDARASQLANGLSHVAGGIGNRIRQLPGQANNWRRGLGADLAHHLTSVSGEAAAQHIGGKFGTVAGTAIGGLFGGPVGAGVGSFLGGHAGSFVAGRHAAPHIARGAEWIQRRLRG